MTNTQCDIPMASLTGGSIALAVNTLIEVRVSATNDYGTSTVSTTNTAGAYTAEAPGQMAAVTFSAISSNELTIDWVALSGASSGYSAITAYKLYSTDSSGNSEVLIYSGLDLTFDYTVTGGVTYYFEITATNLYGTGSASALATQKAAQVPDQMSIATVANSGTDIVITMPAVSDNDEVIDYYEVYFEKSDSSFTEVTGCLDPTALTCTVTMANAVSATSKTADELIVVKTRAHNSLGFGEYSQENTSGGAYQTKPGQMDAPTYDDTTSDNDHVDLTWTVPTGTTAGGTGVSITSYMLEWNQGSGINVWQTLEAATTLTTKQQTGLTEGETYQFRVTATNAYGTGDTASSTVSYKATTTPAAPSITGVVVDGSFMKISWSTSPDDNGESVTAY